MEAGPDQDVDMKRAWREGRNVMLPEGGQIATATTRNFPLPGLYLVH